MTPLEFEKMEERVEKYKESKNRIYRLGTEKRSILNSISNIISDRKNDIDSRARYAEFQDRLEKEITEFYENEINITRKNMEEI